MRVAVLTLTRDRLDYTKHCFTMLIENAGCDFDHYVLDNGSTDETQEWLRYDYAPQWLDLRPGNIGVSKGMNALLREVRGYDVVVKFDNDCELTTPGTLKAACDVALTGEWLCSPHIQGLNDPPTVRAEHTVVGYRVGVTVGNIGGIFLAAPAHVYDGYRHDEANPIWGMDDVNLCAHWRSQGHEIGYLLDYPANHYETTLGQRERYPEYWARKEKEFAG